MKLNQIKHLLTPDATEGGTEVDPLSGAAAGWEAPKFPLLAPDRIYRFKIAKCTKAATKDDANREALTIQLKTEKDYTDTDGKPLRAGFTGYKRIGITPITEEQAGDKRPRSIKDIGADLGMALKSCGKGDKSPRELLNNPSLIEGEIVDMKVGISKGRDGFPDSNTFTFVLPA